jgi:hypothetical protein
MSARFRKLCAFDEQIAPGLGCAIMVIVVLAPRRESGARYVPFKRGSSRR